MIDFEQVKKATSDEFVGFIQSTLKEWQVDNYIWRLDQNWVGEVFVHVLVDREKVNFSVSSHLMQFVYRSGIYEFHNINGDALKWLKINL